MDKRMYRVGDVICLYAMEGIVRSRVLARIQAEGYSVKVAALILHALEHSSDVEAAADAFVMFRAVREAAAVRVPDPEPIGWRLQVGYRASGKDPADAI